LVTVSEETDFSEIARLLTAHRIKRVPVVRDGRVIGIVSRADLLRGLALGEPKPAAPEASATGHRISDWLDKQFPHAHCSEKGHPTVQPLAAASTDAASIDDIRRQWFEAVDTFAAWSAISSARGAPPR
jgi:predicted transcriptional regulator